MRKSLKRTCRPPAWVFHHIVSPSTRIVFKTLGLPHQDGYFPKTQEMIGVWPWYCHHIVINTVNFRLNTFGHRHGPRFGVYPQQQTFKQDENSPKRMSSKHGCAIVGVLRSKHIWLLRLSSMPAYIYIYYVLVCLVCLVWYSSWINLDNCPSHRIRRIFRSKVPGCMTPLRRGQPGTARAGQCHFP